MEELTGKFTPATKLSTSTLTSVPVEILLSILSYTTLECNKSLFSTCRSLANIIRPVLFHTLVIENLDSLNRYISLLLVNPSLAQLTNTLIINSIHPRDNSAGCGLSREDEIKLHAQVAEIFGFRTLREMKIEALKHQGSAATVEKRLAAFLKRPVLPEERVLTLLEVLSNLERFERNGLDLEPAWIKRFILEAVTTQKSISSTSGGTKSEQFLLEPFIQRPWGVPDPRFAKRFSKLKEFKEINPEFLTTNLSDLWGLMFLVNMRTIECNKVQGMAILGPDKDYHQKNYGKSDITKLILRDCRAYGQVLTTTLRFTRVLTHFTYTCSTPEQWRRNFPPSLLGEALQILSGTLEYLEINMDEITAFGREYGHGPDEGFQSYDPEVDRIGSFKSFERLKRLRIPVCLLYGGYSRAVFINDNAVGQKRTILSDLMPPSLVRFEAGFETLTTALIDSSFLFSSSEDLVDLVQGSRDARFPKLKDVHLFLPLVRLEDYDVYGDLEERVQAEGNKVGINVTASKIPFEL
ncbi:hypothetical protein DFH27DRAFT_569418 [Peziza echinospora]|nr:hypothetical protein DFH27DRAFT_569418 [Peziza echinospora]